MVFLLHIVHGIDSFLGIGFLGISDKPKTAASASVTVLNHHLHIHRIRIIMIWKRNSVSEIGHRGGCSR
jgi:hypothetical protein